MCIYNLIVWYFATLKKKCFYFCVMNCLPIKKYKNCSCMRNVKNDLYMEWFLLHKTRKYIYTYVEVLKLQCNAHKQLLHIPVYKILRPELLLNYILDKSLLIKRTLGKHTRRPLLVHGKKMVIQWYVCGCARPSFRKNMLFHMVMGVGRRKLQCTHHLNTNCWFNNLFLNIIFLSNMVYMWQKVRLKTYFFFFIWCRSLILKRYNNLVMGRGIQLVYYG